MHVNSCCIGCLRRTFSCTRCSDRAPPPPPPRADDVSIVNVVTPEQRNAAEKRNAIDLDSGQLDEATTEQKAEDRTASDGGKGAQND